MMIDAGPGAGVSRLKVQGDRRPLLSCPCHCIFRVID